MDPRIWDIVREDPRYAYEAYEFVCEAVTFTQDRLGRAPVVFKQWGLRKTDDIGEIVFNLIRAEKLSKSDRDDPDDFRDLFDLTAALVRGFELTTADYAPRKADR